MALLPAGSAASPSTGSASFTTPGESAFVVPAGVTSVQAVLVGANGGPSYAGNPAAGGAGATVQATLAVMPGETLFVEVGGNGLLGRASGGSAGGTNGGGRGADDAAGGGGATDVRTCSVSTGAAGDPASCATTGTLASRLLVAGGGGGGGGPSGASSDIAGGQGGAAGSQGNAGSMYYGTYGGGSGGGAALQSAGGSPGATPTGTYGGSAGFTAAGSGSLGGGGLYGGGGGGAGAYNTDDYASGGGGGGGGGGSSGVPAGAAGVTGYTIEKTANGAQPSATLTWTVVPNPVSVTGTPSGVTSTTATLNGTVNPEGFVVTDCHFAIAPSASGAVSIPCAQQVGAGSSPVAVSSQLTGLTPGTTYTVTLESGCAQGSNGGAAVQFTTAAPPVGIASAGKAIVKGTTVTLPVTCTGGTSCTVTLSLSVVETLKGGKVVAVSASALKSKSKTTKKVVVGSTSATVNPGQTQSVTVALNATGHALLHRRHSLPAQLSASQTLTGTSSAVASQTVTFKLAKPKKHKH